MKISEYIKEYTNGGRFYFKDVLIEFWEFVVEVLKLDWKAANIEFQDILHFLQLWLYWRLGINGEIWKSTMKSVNKFMARLPVWRKIYKEAGLDENISNFCGNCQKEIKVIKQLARFGVDSETAKKAYNKVVLNKS